jgi:hypothetical protein
MKHVHPRSHHWIKISNFEHKNYNQIFLEGKKKHFYTPQACRDPKHHCKHCSIDGLTKETCWKLHPHIHLKNKNKHAKQSMTTQAEGEEIECNLEV